MSKTITSKIIDGRAWTINDEFTIVDIPSIELDTVISWIKLNIIPNATPFYEVSSYDLAVALEKETGVYITNNQFKDAMLECGYYPADEGETNWNFCISSVSPAIKNCPKHKTYRVKEHLTFMEVLKDRRLSLSEIGIMAIVIKCFKNKAAFKAEDFGKYSYENIEYIRTYLKLLEKYRYIFRV
jgi:hypothetical protein